MRRRLLAVVAGTLASLLIASTALGFECTNVSKSSPEAGTQVVFGPTGEIVWVSRGLLNRIERGIVDPETGAGFHGLVGFDMDGDGIADASTYIGVGSEGEIPLQAQLNGPACRGLTNLFVYFTECVGA
ncbi:MAG TPA: hypothetical protein VK845_03990 [Gemmatimonadales bacterium]|nr:hypothetical protein [Gemmatimonadales bacterium]